MALNCGTFGLSQKSLPLGEFLLLLSNTHRLLNSSVHFKKHACWKYSIYLNRPPSGHRVMNSGKNANQVCVQRSRENLTFQSIALSMIYFTHMWLEERTRPTMLLFSIYQTTFLTLFHPRIIRFNGKNLILLFSIRFYSSEIEKLT